MRELLQRPIRPWYGVDSVHRSGATHSGPGSSIGSSEMSIRQIVDESRLSPLQIVVIGVCFFLNMLDGMDVLAISFAAPVIAGDWGISRSALGIAFSAALVGMALGAVVLSPYTDMIGRRKMVLLSSVVITLGMVATAFAQSVTQLPRSGSWPVWASAPCSRA